MTEDKASASPWSAGGDGGFLDRLSSATEMVTALRFREAEVEILRALSITPAEVSALKLLALVRFKLGRLDEALVVCRELAAAWPSDAGIRLNGGLIALKLDRIDEGVSELEVSARLAPQDPRAWGYLGFAYARRGEPARAAAAFRRAGQEERAVAVEREERAIAPPDARPAPGWSPSSSSISSPSPLESIPAAAFASAFDASPPTEVPEPAVAPNRFLTQGRLGSGGIAVSPLGAWAIARLAPPAGEPAWVGATARLAIGDEIFVRADAAVACSGAARWQGAHRRVQGRPTEEALGGAGSDLSPFCRVTGQGEVFVGAPTGRLVPLRLEDDILYVREDRVLAFEGTVSWENGRVPRSALRMLQFRGQGIVAIRVNGEPGAIRVAPDRPLWVSPAHLLGWIGQVVPRGTHRDAAEDPQEPAAGWDGGGPFGIACEGEGVVLVDVASADGAKNRAQVQQEDR